MYLKGRFIFGNPSKINANKNFCLEAYTAACDSIKLFEKHFIFKGKVHVW